VIRLANAALDAVRRRTQQTTTGHRGRKADPLYRIRRRLVAAHDRLGPDGFARVLAYLDAGDLRGEAGAAYLAKELLRGVLPRRRYLRRPPPPRCVLELLRLQ
jgi:transposase